MNPFNQSLNSSYHSQHSINKNEKSSFQTYKIEEQQDHTIPQNQQEDSFHSQV